MAEQQLNGFAVPKLYDAADPHVRIFFVLPDGTGNDAINDPTHITNIGLLKAQLDAIKENNPSIGVGYLSGPGTQGGLTGALDAATGSSYEWRVEALYDQVGARAKIWLQEDPAAKIRVVEIGFSRGAAEAVGVSNLIDQRGFQDPNGKHYTYSDVSGQFSVSYTTPALVAPGQTAQALGLHDPVGTGAPSAHDLQPSSSVISGFQITAIDEKRDLFPSTSIVDQYSTDPRFLGVRIDAVPGPFYPFRRFERSFAAVVGTLFFLSLSGVTHASGPEPSSRENPPDLRTLFVEAEGEVQVKTLKNMPITRLGAGPYWIDNHRVIYTVRQLGDWQAQKDEKSKIIIFDVDSDAIEETPYRGDLACYSPEGQVLVQDYAFRLPNTLQPGDAWEDSQFYLTGKLGEPLTRFKRPKEQGMLDDFSCRFYDGYKHDFGQRHGITPLRSGDGVLDVPFLDAPEKNVRLVSPEGKVQWSIEVDKLCSHGNLHYLPWLDRYFKSTSWGNVAPGCIELNKDSRLFSARSVEIKPLPRFIQEMRRPGRQVGGNGSTYWARPGMYVFVQYSDGFDGLYWNDEKSGQLKRVLKQPWGLANLSPDGCRNLVPIKPHVLVELCKGEKR